MKILQTSLIAAAFALSASSSFAQQVLERSGPPAQLVELFTSEGCSSCPPADNYLSQMVNAPNLWDEIVPMAFHVDYWDYIGWKDRFAQPHFKQRQYDYRRTGKLRSVYTPGWVVDGKEWRGFFRNDALPSPRKGEGGHLKAVIENQQVKVKFKPSSAQQKLTAHVAVLGFDLSSQVTDGENEGRLLKHQFVVLDKQQKPQVNYEWQFDLPQLDKGKRHGIAVWITQPGKQPLQAAGDWLTLN